MIWPDWTGQPCVVVASGPSAQGCNLEEARGRARVIAVNTSIRLAPWADMLYAADWKWWSHHKAETADFRGVRASVKSRRHRDARIMQVPYDLNGSGFGTGKKMTWGRNSGFQAVNLALRIGVRRVVLVGFDMHDRNGIHWHGAHPNGLSNPRPGSLGEWAALMDASAPSAVDLGVEIVNASQTSALTAYRKMDWREAIAWLI